MTQESFYIDLISNASMDFYPDNSLSKFSNKLAVPLEFSGEWEVALNEIFYPIIFKKGVRSEKFTFCISQEDMTPYKIWAEYTFSYEEEDSIETIVNSLNEFMKEICFSNQLPGEGLSPPLFSLKGNYVSLQSGDFESRCMYPKFKSDDLYETLGFINKDYIEAAKNFDRFTKSFVYTGSLPAVNNFKASLLFIYSDIIREHAVGDSSSPLLRVAPLSKGTFESVGHITFSNPYYYKLRSSRIETVNILLCNEFGNQVKFDKGRVHISLHFRKSI